ncbi:MAG: transketolase [Planctomycetes bacterium]|nr:transketolase [Planctomycetota bacterium]
MRLAFVNSLCKLAEKDDRLWLVCGDLGYGVLDEFARRFPNRFINAGVAEQNMAGVAAGLAQAGQRVFVYSIANFPVMRCMEQIRNDIAYHRLPVCVVTVGGGLVYGGHGYSHHGVEDLAMMHVLPNMTVFAPADPVETRLVTEAAASIDGPVYLRLGRGGEATLHKQAPAFAVGKALCLRKGATLALFSTGGILEPVLSAAEALTVLGHPPSVYSLPTFFPLDEETIAAESRRCQAIVTIEEHGRGGLAALTAEVLAQSGGGARLIPIRLPREPLAESGSHAYLRERQGLSAAAMVQHIQTTLAAWAK